MISYVVNSESLPKNLNPTQYDKLSLFW